MLRQNPNLVTSTWSYNRPPLRLPLSLLSPHTFSLLVLPWHRLSLSVGVSLASRLHTLSLSAVRTCCCLINRGQLFRSIHRMLHNLQCCSFMGGNSTKATSGINGAGTTTQQDQGIPDSARIFFDDTKRSVCFQRYLPSCLRSYAGFDHSRRVNLHAMTSFKS